MAGRPVTTEELLTAEMDRTGLPREQCLQIVGKSAAIRAMTQRYGDRFVLKGGTLLYHVYDSARASYKDADLAEPEASYENPDEVGEILTLKDEGLHLRGDEGTWREREAMIEGLEIPVDIGGIGELPRHRQLKITVSLRPSEHLDPPETPLIYRDRMLAYDNSFKVNGLSLDELAAEKIIGWALRGAPKHYADLGLIARDHEAFISPAKVVELTRQKVSKERQHDATKGFYDANEVRRPRDLVTLFRSPVRSGQLHQRNWEQVVGADFFFMADEEDRDRPFSQVTNVHAEVARVWGPVLDALDSS